MPTPDQEATVVHDAIAVIASPPLSLPDFNFLNSGSSVTVNADQVVAVLLARLVLAIEAGGPAPDPAPAIVAAIEVASAANVAAVEAAAAAIVAAVNAVGHKIK
jgi:hypothetical protein